METDHEVSTTKPSSSSTQLKNSSFSSPFTRSITFHSTPNSFSHKPYFSSHENHNNPKKWYNSFESAGTSFKGKVKQLRTLFESPKTLSLQSSKLLSHPSFTKLGGGPQKSIGFSVSEASSIRFPGTEDRVVVYFTSLRGIRRTFEDCYAVRMIFRGYRVFVDERDVSMDNGYRKESQGLLGGKNLSLPHVFIGGRYFGGVDVIRQLNETGELRKLLQGLPVKDRRFGCDGCGDVRFLPCSNCSGSRKVFDEDDGVMKRCLECNENGLIRCPECCL